MTQKILILLLAIGAFLAGRWQVARVDAGRPETRAAAGRRLLYYVCPMHPQYRSDRPGEAPCCGMRLEPVYADQSPGANSGVPAGAVHISEEKRQLIGIRFAPAEVTSGVQALRAVGRMAYDNDESIVIADVLEHQASRVEVGQPATVSAPFHPEQSFSATVDYVYPRLDTATRTLKVRLRGLGSGRGLLADTFVNVDFRIPGPAALTVPADAVLDSGLRQVVYVERGGGYVEPRPVETGRRLGERIEIRKGLTRGERVATAGNFLIDSESRIRGAASPPAKQPVHPAIASVDPVCGMEVDPAKAAGRSEDRGRTYYFCSRDCQEKFDQARASFAKKESPAAHSPAVAHPERKEAAAGREPGEAAHRDPICGKQVEEHNAYRRTMLYRDVTLYFCSEDCYREFVRNPEVYGQKAVPTVVLRQPAEITPITPDTIPRGRETGKRND